MNRAVLAWAIAATAAAGALGIYVVTRRNPAASPSHSATPPPHAAFARMEQAILKGDRKAALQASTELQLIGPSIIPAIQDMAVRTPSYEYARLLAGTLGGLRHTESAKALAEVYRRAAQPHGDLLRLDVVAAMSRLGGETAESELAALCRDEKDASRREHIAARLRTWASARTLESLQIPSVDVKERDADIAESARINRLDPDAETEFAALVAVLSSTAKLGHRVDALRRLELRASFNSSTGCSRGSQFVSLLGRAE